MVTIEVHLRRTGEHGEPLSCQTFELAPGDEVVFGRAVEADVLIPDPERRVSSRHGRIACTPEGGLVAADLGSLNGTFLSDVKLEAGEDKELSDESVLRAGDYDLIVIVQQEEFGATIRTLDVSGASDRLTVELEQIYANCLDLDPATRQEKLRAAVDSTVTGMSPREGTALLLRLVDGSSTACAGAVGPGAGPWGVAAGSAATTAAADLPPDGDAAATVLQELARALVPGTPLESADDQRRFGTLLAQVCDATLSWLARGLESRNVFAQEFGAEVTLVFQRSNNPLKAMTRDQLVEYLLDWRGEADTDARGRYLEAVLKDLTEHQVGVLAGVREAVARVVQRLSPDNIEAVAKNAKGWSHTAKVWSAYQDLHAQLAAEQNKLYDELISPAIQKGYLQRHDQADG